LIEKLYRRNAADPPTRLPKRLNSFTLVTN